MREKNKMKEKKYNKGTITNTNNRIWVESKSELFVLVLQGFHSFKSLKKKSPERIVWA